MRPIFCANFEFETRQSDLERLFSKYGRVERVDMKSGFAFISMDDEQDAEDAIRALDQKEFGRQGRRLRVDWTKQERGGRKPGGPRSSGNSKPTKTLFVINFDPMQTRTSDLEKHFDPYGKILSIRIRRNFAFIQYELQEDATKALDATNMSKLMDEVVSVEYAVRDDDGRRNRYSPDQRGRDRSPERSRDRRRSPSPPRRQRDSPDYGHGPISGRSHNRVRRTSPQGRDRDSPDYGRRPSPDAKRERRGNIYPRERGSPDSGLAPSPPMKPEPRDGPFGRERVSPNHDGPKPKPERRGNLSRRGRDSPDAGRGPSPNRKPEPRSPRQERDSPDRAYAKPETRYNSNQQDKGSPNAGPNSSPTAKDEHRVVIKDAEHGEVTTENERDGHNLGSVESPQRSKAEPSGSSKHARTRGRDHEKKHSSHSPSAHKAPREAEKKQKRDSTDV